MALPDKNIIQQLSITHTGHPFCAVTASSSINADSLEISFNGHPWWGHGGEGGSTSDPTFKIYAGESAVTKMYVGASQVQKVYLGETLVQQF